MWSSVDSVPSECRQASVLFNHQAIAKDQMEKQSMKMVFEVAWRDLLDKVMKNHLPHYLLWLEELYDGKLIPYPPPLMYSQINRCT